ncbi:kin of IRRE-like protein 1 [Rhincodon typus]|uniref:kin of IRRE-like protein 1 n=1 Tax=Rhincodon typus TaxID=259920 RepID=UPI00202E14C6|nr:kin of IRRE-like protein 1 [Rhincodon typus]
MNEGDLFKKQKWGMRDVDKGVSESVKAVWPRYRVLGDLENGVYDLEIQEAQLSDDAVYECQATEAALRSDRATLTVLIPPDEPVIDGGPEILLRAGIPYNLTCRVEGAKPAAGIEWYSAGVRQQGTSSTHGLMDDGKREYTISVLPFSPSELDIGRELSCQARNEALPSGKESTVRLNVHHLPSVTLSIYPQKVREGDRVVFTCAVSANPAIKQYR